MRYGRWVSQKSGRKLPQDDSASAESKASDTLLIHGVSDDGQALAVLRAREDRIEAGVVRPLKEGEPVMGEVVRLKPRPEMPLVCDVEVTLPSPVPKRAAPAKLSHGGPAQVATPRYRENWDAIWAKPKRSGSDELN
jgi:hypothetical protein